MSHVLALVLCAVAIWLVDANPDGAGACVVVAVLCTIYGAR